MIFYHFQMVFYQLSDKRQDVYIYFLFLLFKFRDIFNAIFVLYRQRWEFDEEDEREVTVWEFCFWERKNEWNR